MRREPPEYITFADRTSFDTPMKFRLQPIVRLHDGSAYGYEMLYRGPRLPWTEVDRALLTYLGETDLSLPRLFINIANESLTKERIALLVDASLNTDLIVELSEAHTTAEDASQIAGTVNAAAARGVRFALDDFGCGQDGFQRLFALDSVGIIKLDGSLIRSAMVRADAAKTLRSLVNHWKTNGVVTVAECIEDEAMLDTAEAMGIDMVQGFYLDGLAPFRIARMAMWRSNRTMNMVGNAEPLRTVLHRQNG